MINLVEVIAAALCVVIAAYVLLDELIPMYLLAFVAVGVVAGLLVLPDWMDR